MNQDQTSATPKTVYVCGSCGGRFTDRHCCPVATTSTVVPCYPIREQA